MPGETDKQGRNHYLTRIAPYTGAVQAQESPDAQSPLEDTTLIHHLHVCEKEMSEKSLISQSSHIFLEQELQITTADGTVSSLSFPN